MAETSQSLAKEAIRRLSDAIEQRFGLRVVMGAEVEYVADTTRESRQLDKDNPLQVSMLAKSSGEPPKYFEGNPLVLSHYKEKPPNQYEVVLNHEAFDNPAALADAIEAVKSDILKLGEQQKLAINFAPAIDIKSPSGLTTNALHINFSLQNARGENALSEDPNVSRYLLHRVMDVMQETIALQAPEKDSYKRFHLKNSGFEPQRFDNLHGMRIRMSQNGDGIEMPHTTRLENRFPDTNADPYATIAATLAGIYYALSRTEDVAVENGVITPGRAFSASVDKGAIPKDLATAIEALEHSVVLPAVLNEVSGDDRLGDRFVAAASQELREKSVAAKVRRSFWSVG